MASTVQFEVVGEEKIHCAGCESRIAAGLRRLPGVEDVQASAETQRVRVAIDPARTSEDEVRARLAQLGYQTARK
ncbi:MAG TPA: heavy metal-associated domain-containing protein [Burkholderiales bacterium]